MQCACRCLSIESVSVGVHKSVVEHQCEYGSVAGRVGGLLSWVSAADWSSLSGPQPSFGGWGEQWHQLGT